MKRFWAAARIAREGDGFVVLLDGRKMRLPGGPGLSIASEALAQAIAGEWQAAGGAKGGEVAFDALPLTRLAATAQLRVTPDPVPVVSGLAAYAGSDLLCYRAEAPQALAARQAVLWQPWLDWAAREHGAVFVVASGVMPVRQPAAAVAAMHRALAAQSAAALAGLGVLVPALGSVVLGLAVAAGALGAAEAADLALLDERFQAELWGDDCEAVQRRAAICAEVGDAARFIELSRPGRPRIVMDDDRTLPPVPPV